MLLSETAVDDAAVMIVGTDRKHSQIEFGAHQVLLVRNQLAKDKLPPFFDGCLAMTILESKGLEFDDVFLWNFLTGQLSQKSSIYMYSMNVLGHSYIQKSSIYVYSECTRALLYISIYVYSECSRALLYSECTRTLTFENLAHRLASGQGMAACPHVFGRTRFLGAREARKDGCCREQQGCCRHAPTTRV